MLIVLLISIPSVVAGIALSATPLVQTAQLLRNPPSDKETLGLWNPEAHTPAGKIEAALLNHPLTRALEEDPRFQVSRPHMKIPPNLRPKSFTGGALMAPDKIAVPPMVFSTGDGMEMVSICYLGDAVCGHPGVVHGGMLATLMDEGLARTCFAALPSKTGVTASLKVDYRAPCLADQFIVLKAQTTKVEGRKAWVKGRIETLPADGSTGKVLVEGEALFIEPRGFATSLLKIAS
jgi:acyl-coenzyme A thioesterase PaaI-like protein